MPASINRPTTALKATAKSRCALCRTFGSRKKWKNNEYLIHILVE
jgi:hypothetical protein